MKTTYTGTIFHPDLAEAKVVLYLSEGLKWETDDEGNMEEHRVEYTGVTAWDIIQGGPEADAIEQNLNEDEQDEIHEYLVLHFEGKSTATFRNSHTTMFIW